MLSKDEVYGVARTVLSAAGGYLVARGVVDAQTAVSVSGAAATLIAAAWSVRSKRRRSR